MTETFLLKNLVLFGRILRAVGLDAGPSQVLDLAAALEYVDLGKRQDFYYTARALFAHRRNDLALFDVAFQLFWRSRNAEPNAVLIEQHPALKAKSLRVPRPHHTFQEDAASQDLEGARESEQVLIELRQTYSEIEVLRRKNFEEYTWEEVQRAKQLMAEMTWRTGERATRRKKSVVHGAYLDMRRIIRRNVKYGGEFLDLAWKETRFKSRPLVVLCDISGSMERYSRMLLHFTHTLCNGLEHVEAFLFGTRLTRITLQLRRKDIDQAVGEVVSAVEDWGGGTRIGEALHTFNYRWARRVAARGAVVLIISDGWDRGDTEMLKREMERLQKSCFRLIWLNPLLGMPGYEPLTRGLQAALPYMDDFMPVHNLDSLNTLGRTLSQLQQAPRARGKRQSALDTNKK
ncbi:MAG TPA: VWA domain-containing protein [Anaerolineae bacterium]